MSALPMDVDTRTSAVLTDGTIQKMEIATMDAPNAFRKAMPTNVEIVCCTFTRITGHDDQTTPCLQETTGQTDPSG
eukprot:GDKH01003190.1.p4 GENE.GDKH01003190.1~~GDKH01003190.1.p4  ORF type:complete len:76 (+),score=2.53 GDKH01003190.1:65-292(+)